MNYYIVTNSDGDIRFQKYANASEVIEAITPDESGDSYYGDVSRLTFGTNLDNLDYMGERELIILKGEVIVPRPKDVVRSFEID